MARIPEPDLERGETLLWTGAPPRGPMLRGSDIFLIPFSLVWAGGVIGIFSVRTSDQPFPAFSLFFIAMAIYITFGRFIADAWSRSRTAYAVTSDRVVITSGVQAGMLRGMSFGGVPQVPVFERINDAKGVYHIIRNAQRQATSA